MPPPPPPCRSGYVCITILAFVIKIKSKIVLRTYSFWSFCLQSMHTMRVEKIQLIGTRNQTFLLPKHTHYEFKFLCFFVFCNNQKGELNIVTLPDEPAVSMVIFRFLFVEQSVSILFSVGDKWFKLTILKLIEFFTFWYVKIIAYFFQVCTILHCHFGTYSREYGFY